MTDYPIPDNLRDQFVERAARAWRNPSHKTLAAWRLDDLTAAGFRIELRLPEFAVHDDTCCGGSGERFVNYDDGHAGGFPHPCPCPGVGYYHWTVA
jgi:hypothetical protein